MSSTPMQNFIGRQHELAILRATLDRALAGQGQVVLLVGEPGIGKTRTVQAFSDMVAGRGVLVLCGRCHEQPGAPSYWPWVQVLRRFAEQQNDQALRAALGTGASYIAEICPELRDRVPGLSAAQPLTDSGQARFRMFDAVSEFWKRAAATQPLLLILEDVHWADVPSMRLLEFVAGEIAGCSLLLVATLREAELSGEHPLVAALSGLRRKPAVQRLPLSGLTAEETGRLMTEATGTNPSSTMTAFVMEKTGGNPLFVAEMARHLAEEGLLTAGAFSSGLDAKRAAWRVPEGIRAVIATRLNRLSATAKRVLQGAAVIGMQFRFILLRRLIEDLPEGQLLTALDEALAPQIIEDVNDPGRYQFGHVLTRETLYDEMPSLDRTRLHHRIGLALEEEHQYDLVPYLPLLAHHFNAALPGCPDAKAISYATRAGDQAQARLAYEEAVRYFSLALNALDHTASHETALRCKLLIALGSAQLKSGHAVQALEALTEAAMRASQLGALNDLAQAAIEFEEVAWRLALPGMRAVRLLEQALRQLGQAEDKTRGKLQSSMVRALVFAEMPDQASRLHRQTVQLARRVGDPETLEAALRSGFWLRWDPGDLEDWLAAADEAVALAQQIRSKERVLDAVAFRIHLRVAVGDLHGFSSDLERFAQLADELHQPFHQYHGTSLRAAHALLTGRYSDAETLARGAAKLGTRLPGLDASGAFGMQMFTLAQECGELAQLAPVVRELLRTTPHAGIWRPALALVLAELGQVEEARTELEQLAPQQFQAIARDSLWLACLVYLTQVCALIQEQTHAEVLYALLGPWKGRNVVAGSVAVCYGPADHFLGMLSANLRRWDAAERHFTAAVEMNQRQGSRPWLAHAQYQHAAMLAERGKRGDHQRARVLLASARELTDELQMVTLGQRLSQLERRLDAHPQKPSYPGGLSRREAQVLRLVAAGKSNQEIADAMFRSPNTVANHVRSILTKLGAANRTEAATVAARHGLL